MIVQDAEEALARLPEGPDRDAIARALALLTNRYVPATVDPDELSDDVLEAVLVNMSIEDIGISSPAEVWDKYVNWHGIVGYSHQLRRVLSTIHKAAR